MGGGAFTYLHGDHLGSTVTTTSGTTGTQERYHAYGATRSGGITATDYQYTGQFSDNVTGLIYMNARYYDPTIGQFISPDTIVPDPTNLFDYNRYMYTRGNPLKYSDPSGHCPEGRGKVGSPESECWNMGLTILQQWDTAPDYWNQRFVSKEHFEKWFLNNESFDNEFMNNAMMDFWKSPAWEEAKPRSLPLAENELFFDAALIGGSVSGGFMGFTAGLAVEYVSHEDGDEGLFATLSLGLSAGAGGYARFYDGVVTDLTSLDEYGGESLFIEGGGAIGPIGVAGSVSSDLTPYAPAVWTAGWAAGARGGVSAGKSWTVKVR